MNLFSTSVEKLILKYSKTKKVKYSNNPNI